jgi:hypothetical protein
MHYISYCHIFVVPFAYRKHYTYLSIKNNPFDKSGRFFNKNGQNRLASCTAVNILAKLYAYIYLIFRLQIDPRSYPHMDPSVSLHTIDNTAYLLLF